MLCQEIPAAQTKVLSLRQRADKSPVADAPGSPCSLQAEALLPRTVLGWLPFLWSRVLFPGSPDRPAVWSWRPLLLLLVVAGAQLFPCLSFYLFEPDEG